MLPILVSVGPLTIYSFGLFLSLAIVVGLFTFWRLSRHITNTMDVVFDCAFIGLIGGLIGARIFYIAIHPTLFWPNIWAVVDIIHYPGFVYYGALAGGLVAITFYCQREHFLERQLLDNAALAVSISHAVGLLGAFFAGTAYGAQTRLFWGVTMVGLSGKRHPTQLLEGLLELGLFYFLFRVSKRRHQPGLVALLYILGYAVCRYFIEFFRGDSVYWFSIKSQFLISAIVFLIALIYLKRRFVFRMRSK